MLQTTWHGILTSFLISLGVLLYCKTKLLRYLFWMPLLSVLPRAIALEPGIRSGELPLGVLPIFLFCSVVGLFPFLLLWCGVARWLGFFPKEIDNAEDCAVAEKEET